VQTCDIAPAGFATFKLHSGNLTDPGFVLSAGLDNLLTVYSIVLPAHLTAFEVQVPVKKKHHEGKHDAIPEDSSVVTYRVRQMSGHSNYISTARFINGPETAVSGSGDKSVRLWDISHGKEKGVFRDFPGEITSLDYLDSNIYLTGNTSAGISILDQREGKSVMYLKEHDGDISGLHVSTSGTIFASASEDGTCRLWELKTGKSIATLEGHAGSVALTGCALSSSTHTLYATGEDGLLRAWDTQTTKLKEAVPAHTDRASCLSISTDGRVLISGGWDSALRIWKNIEE